MCPMQPVYLCGIVFLMLAGSLYSEALQTKSARWIDVSFLFGHTPCRKRSAVLNHSITADAIRKSQNHLLPSVVNTEFGVPLPNSLLSQPRKTYLFLPVHCDPS